MTTIWTVKVADLVRGAQDASTEAVRNRVLAGLLILIGLGGCVGGNLALMEPGTGKSRDVVRVSGVVLEDCPIRRAAPGHRVRLLASDASVLAESTSGADGSFTLGAPYTREGMSLEAGGAAARLPRGATIYNRAGNYRAEAVVKCGAEPIAGASTAHETGTAGASSRPSPRLPPPHLRPGGM